MREAVEDGGPKWKGRKPCTTVITPFANSMCRGFFDDNSQCSVAQSSRDLRTLFLEAVIFNDITILYTHLKLLDCRPASFRLSVSLTHRNHSLLLQLGVLTALLFCEACTKKFKTCVLFYHRYFTFSLVGTTTCRVCRKKLLPHDWRHEVTFPHQSNYFCNFVFRIMLRWNQTLFFEIISIINIYIQ